MPIAQADTPAAPLAVALIVLACCASLLFWVAVLARRPPGEILPQEPRRRVPWKGSDVLVVLLAFIALSLVAWEGVHRVLAPELIEPLPAEDVVGPHPVLEAMMLGGAPVLVLCVIAVAVVAPMAEEFLFRVVLQGWLESVAERWLPFLPGLRRWLPGASGPIFLTALLFAAMHFRVAQPRRHGEFLVALMLANAAVFTLLTGFAALWLRVRTGATAADLGLVRGKLAADLRLGLWAVVGLLGPVYALQIAAYLLVPQHVAPDPLPLFFLALGLGVLYARTHRLVPCVVVHAALNAVSLAMAWATLDGPS